MSGRQASAVRGFGRPGHQPEILFVAKQNAALAGASTNPPSLCHHSQCGGGGKYPFHPFYGGFSPRVAVAWSPRFLGDNKTVIRAGYSRIYGRLNGGRVVGSPVLGAGLEQVIQCTGVTTSGQCLGTGGATRTTAFRIGTDGMVAPLTQVTQTAGPALPAGVNGNAAGGRRSGRGHSTSGPTNPMKAQLHHPAGNFRRKLLLEVGYIGRLIRDEYNLINVDAVPTMTTLNGKLRERLRQSVRGSLHGRDGTGSAVLRGGAGRLGSKYCAGYGSCTARGRAAKIEHYEHPGLRVVEWLERRVIVDVGTHAAGVSSRQRGIG